MTDSITTREDRYVAVCACLGLPTMVLPGAQLVPLQPDAQAWVDTGKEDARRDRRIQQLWSSVARAIADARRLADAAGHARGFREGAADAACTETCGNVLREMVEIGRRLILAGVIDHDRSETESDFVARFAAGEDWTPCEGCEAAAEAARDAGASPSPPATANRAIGCRCEAWRALRRWGHIRHDWENETGPARREALKPRVWEAKHAASNLAHTIAMESPVAATTEPAGLYRKFVVERADGSSMPGCKHEHCSYFVLDLQHDRYAAVALRAYYQACSKTLPELSVDLHKLSIEGASRFDLCLRCLVNDAGKDPGGYTMCAACRRGGRVIPRVHDAPPKDAARGGSDG